MPQNTFALSSTAPLSKRPCLKDLQFEQHRSKNTKGNDLEAEATSAPSVFILGAQKKKKKAKWKPRAHNYEDWCSSLVLSTTRT